MKIIISLLIAILIITPAIAANKTVQSFSQAKKKLQRQVYNNHRETIYCAAEFNVDKQVCDCCQSSLHKIGESRSEKLEFVPAHIKVIETIRPKYAYKECEKTGVANHIKTAPMPPTPIPKGIATASLLSQLITAKYQYGLPLYRQESMFNDYGISLSRQTMSDWLMRCSELLMPHCVS
ncbi:MAG: transposase [Alteromonadaceae bacterium]|jgi:transposase